MKNEATKEIRKPPLGLQSRWSHEGRRLREVLNAIERYVTVGVDFPQDWIFELQDLAVSPHMTLEDIQEAYKRISEVWALPFMVDREWPQAFYSFQARLMAHKGAQVCLKCRGEGKVCVSCQRPVDVRGCEDRGGELVHPEGGICTGCGGRGVMHK